MFGVIIQCQISVPIILYQDRVNNSVFYANAKIFRISTAFRVIGLIIAEKGWGVKRSDVAASRSDVMA